MSGRCAVEYYEKQYIKSMKAQTRALQYLGADLGSFVQLCDLTKLFNPFGLSVSLFVSYK